MVATEYGTTKRAHPEPKTIPQHDSPLEIFAVSQRGGQSTAPEWHPAHVCWCDVSVLSQHTHPTLSLASSFLQPIRLHIQPLFTYSHLQHTLWQLVSPPQSQGTAG